MKYFLLFVVVLMLSGCTMVQTKEGGQQVGVDSRTDIAKCVPLGNQRGITADFVQGRPPESIDQDKEFSVGVKFSNYLSSNIVDLRITDGTRNAKGIDSLEQPHQVTVDSPVYNDATRALISPGCKIGLTETQLNFKNNQYTEISVEEPVYFTGTLAYSVNEELKVPFCLFNPLTSSGLGCATEEVITGRQLGDVNMYLPVFIESFYKEIIVDDESSVDVKLVITLEDAGRDLAYGQSSFGAIDARLPLYVSLDKNYNFACESPQQEGSSNSFRLKLFEGKATITCEGSWEGDEGKLQKDFFDVSLDYGYHYFFTSDVVSLKPLKVESGDFDRS